MTENNAPVPALNSGAQRIIDTALEKQQQEKHEQLGTYHWLLALLERHGPMAEALTQGLDAAVTQRYLREQLRQGTTGSPLEQDVLLDQAMHRAMRRGKRQVMERDLAAAILVAAKYPLVETTTTPNIPAKQPESSDAQPVEQRILRPTPLLEQYGRDLTHEAQEGRLPPVIGRDAEIQLMIETLCRTTKRNPVLVGPAGSGKTAIVEGLAQRIARGEVPETLRGSRLLALQPSMLVAGASVVGELEKRMRGLLLEAAQDGILLFIDEVHSMIGAGGAPGSSDIASLLKPALARGELACIAATTDDEYRRFIEPDAALERRFQPIRIQEPTPEQTLTILQVLRDNLKAQRGVEVADPILRWLIEFAQRYLRNRHFPDKAVDLLEQCVAYAITQGKTSVERTEAETVAQRLIGMPLALEERLGSLREQLSARALLAEPDITGLINRLEVTLRGLDLRSSRPNVVALLLDKASAGSEALAGTIAETLFGAAERVITIDFSRFVHPSDVTMLIGAPPGYVGYSDSLPLHRLVQMPWCVLRCENIHACHPAVLAVFIQALASGVLTDARGKRMYLSDTVVLLTAAIEVSEHRSIGFQAGEGTSTQDTRRVAVELLGEELIDQVDLICAELPALDAAQRHWLIRMLQDLAARYQNQGLHVRWDSSLVDWLISKQDAAASQLDWERMVDEELGPVLIRHLPGPDAQPVELIVSHTNSELRVTNEMDDRR